MYQDRETGTTVFTPSDLTDSLACEHLFAEKIKRARGERKWPKREDDENNLIQQKGEDHEATYLAGLEATGKKIAKIEIDDGDWTKPIADTLAALADPTVDVVFQAHLSKGNWRGRADFLERDPATGLFEVMDTKLARSVKPYMVLQLCIYSDALADVQGTMPLSMHIVLGNNERVTLRVNDFIHYYRAATSRLEAQAAANGAGAPTYPWPVAHCANCRLSDECEARRREDDHLTLVAGISRGQAQKLEAAGIKSIAQLAAVPAESRPKSISVATFDRIRRQAQLQQEAEPGRWHLLEPLPGKGFAALPEPNPGDVFYDIEGDPLWDGAGSLEYLHGLWLLDTPETSVEDATFEPLWAHDRAEEKAQFERLIEIFMDRLAANPGMHIYHYAPYEVGAMKRLSQQYGTRENEVDELLRRGVFVDLYRVVVQSLQASVENYSIKSMEKFYMSARTAMVKKGDDSIEQYERWRETGEQGILDEIGAYNEEDCKSTYLLREWLLARQEEAFEKWGRDRVMMPAEEVEDSEEVELTPGQELKQERLQLIASVHERAESTRNAGDEETADFLDLTAELMRYHIREANAAYWDVFGRAEMTEDELERDRESIAGLVPLNADDPEPIARSHAYTFSFPVQEYRIKVGDKPLDPETLDAVGEVIDVDDENRTLVIKRGPSLADVDLPRSLIPGRPINTYEIQDAIARFAEEVLQEPTGGTYPALRKLLRREPPLGGAVLQRDTYEERIELPNETLGSYLLAQGPPGTGKTYIGARMIVELMKAGKRVGVTATGHSAIHNLLDEVEHYASEINFEFRGVKKASGGKDRSFHQSKVGLITNMVSNADVHDAAADLVAGTAWLFSRPEWDRELDYMFVDEAGQMALATTIAVGTAAQSLVLLGDPAQLPQVTRGSHPDGSGASSMEHVLGDHATIPGELGLFLETTHRLHPEICTFVSDAFYESRLRPEAKTASHVTTAGAGLRYLAVEHEGNSLYSEEEAIAIAAEIDRLRREGTDDIIVVAPYNAQVDLIKEHVPADVEVGTVDRFQGREADVVFYSLAASSRDEVPRGLEFLFAAPRFNVAISRAKALAYLVGSPGIVGVDARSVEEMRLADRVCAFVELAELVADS